MKAIVHIGVEKTGSTSLQHALANHRAELERRGFFYPKYDGADAHRQLPLLAAPFQDVVDLWSERGVWSDDDAAAHRDVFINELEGDVETHPDKTFIFSSEHCHSRILDNSSILLLKDILDKYFDDIEIVTYLRRQDTLALSFHNNYLLGGGTSKSPLEANNSIAYFDPRSLIERWSSVFGIDKLKVRLWNPSDMFSVVTDFFSLISLEFEVESQPRENKSLSCFQRSILHAVNSNQDFDKDISAIARLFIVKSCHFGSDDAPVHPENFQFMDRKTAMTLTEMFSSSNEWVREKFFQSEKNLFDNDFSEYCEEPAWDLDIPALSASSARAIYAAAHEWAIMRAELAYYRGKAHLDAGLLDVALEEFGEGLAANPRHAALWHMGALTKFSRGETKEATRFACRAAELEPDNEAHRIIISNFEKVVSGQVFESEDLSSNNS